MTFEEEDCDQERWNSQEMPDYIDRIKMIGSSTLLVNYLADSNLNGDFSFGGAFAISGQGEVIGSFPLGTEGILIVEV